MNENPETLQTEPGELTAMRPEAAYVSFTDVVCDGAVFSVTIREGMTPDLMTEMFLNLKAMRPTGEQVFGEDNFYIIGKDAARYGNYQPPAKSNDLPARNLDDETTGADSDPEYAKARARATQEKQPTGDRDGVFVTTVTNADGQAFEITQYTKAPNADGRYVHVADEIKVTGDLEKPKIEFRYSGLQYPVAYSALWVVKKALSDRYGLSSEDMDESYGFGTIGSKTTVHMVVYLEDSENLNRNGKPYKNLVDVVDLDLEGENVGQPEPKVEPEPEPQPKAKAAKMTNGPEEQVNGWDSTKLWMWAKKVLSPALIFSKDGKTEADVAKVVRDAIAAVTDENGNTDWSEVYGLLAAQYEDELAAVGEK